MAKIATGGKTGGIMGQKDKVVILVLLGVMYLVLKLDNRISRRD